MANILLIDDSVEIRELLELILVEEGHHVTVAVDGEQGLARYEEGSFDLIITDIIMPNEDGIGLIIKLMEQNNTTPIIAMSGGRREVTSEFLLESVAHMGVTEVLKKPFTDTELCDAISRILN